MDNKFFTVEGLKKLKEELESLQTTKRQQVADRIKQAKEFGDLSENAEYQEAKEEQAFIEGRIIELEHLLKAAVIVDERQRANIVTVGSEVTVEKNGQESRFFIVGSNEADPINGKISLESPLGKALLDHSVNDQIEVQSPTGKMIYKILGIK